MSCWLTKLKQKTHCGESLVTYACATYSDRRQKKSIISILAGQVEYGKKIKRMRKSK